MTYEVISLTVGGVRGKIYKKGEKLPASAFISKNIPNLIKNGSLRELPPTKVEQKTTKQVVEKGGKTRKSRKTFNKK